MQQQQNMIMNQMPMHSNVMNSGNVNANNGIPPAINNMMNDNSNAAPVQTVPIQGISPVKSHMSNTQPAPIEPVAMGQQVLSKTRMSDLVRDIDPNIYMEDEVEEILLSYVDEFVDRVLNGASLIAKHRHVNTIEVKDVQQFVNRNYNMWVPGFGTDELKPYKRSLTTESHKARMALIRKALKKY